MVLVVSGIGVALALLSLALALASAVRACGDDHDHAHDHSRSRVVKRVQEYSSSSWSIAGPTRPLEWGELNVIHTTDSHGWLLGHQKASAPEPNYSGTFGDFADFVRYMKEEAVKRGVDLLLVDSGDVHDGTGLSDGFLPGGVDAHDVRTSPPPPGAPKKKVSFCVCVRN